MVSQNRTSSNPIRANKQITINHDDITPHTFNVCHVLECLTNTHTSTLANQCHTNTRAHCGMVLLLLLLFPIEYYFLFFFEYNTTCSPFFSRPRCVLKVSTCTVAVYRYSHICRFLFYFFFIHFFSSHLALMVAPCLHASKYFCLTREKESESLHD